MTAPSPSSERLRRRPSPPRGEGFAHGLGIAVLALLLTTPAHAQEPPPAPDQPLPQAAQEARAQALFDDIRCVVCQHEAIADSPAGIAADMRRLVREEIAAGRTDKHIRQDLVRRYGDFVLFKPPVRLGTWLLWFGPLAALLLVAAALIRRARRPNGDTAPLSPDEEARLADILAEAEVRRDPDAKASDD